MRKPVCPKDPVWSPLAMSPDIIWFGSWTSWMRCGKGKRFQCLGKESQHHLLSNLNSLPLAWLTSMLCYEGAESKNSRQTNAWSCLHKHRCCMLLCCSCWLAFLLSAWVLNVFLLAKPCILVAQKSSRLFMVQSETICEHFGACGIPFKTECLNRGRRWYHGDIYCIYIILLSLLQKYWHCHCASNGLLGPARALKSWEDSGDWTRWTHVPSLAQIPAAEPLPLLPVWQSSKLPSSIRSWTPTETP